MLDLANSKTNKHIISKGDCMEDPSVRAFFLWLSLSGFIVGTVLYLFPTTSLEILLVIVAILFIVSIFIWRRYGIQHRAETDHPILNKRGNLGSGPELLMFYVFISPFFFVILSSEPRNCLS